MTINNVEIPKEIRASVGDTLWFFSRYLEVRKGWMNSYKEFSLDCSITCRADASEQLIRNIVSYLMSQDVRDIVKE